MIVLKVLLCYIIFPFSLFFLSQQRLAFVCLNNRLEFRVVNIYPGVGYFVPLLENSIARSLVVNDFREAAGALRYVGDVFLKTVVRIAVYCNLFVYNIVVNFFEVVRYSADYID